MNWKKKAENLVEKYMPLTSERPFRNSKKIKKLFKFIHFFVETFAEFRKYKFAI